MDATYRADLREINELNFARFDAKLGQRVVELEARLERRMAQFEGNIEQRMGELRAGMKVRFAAVDSRFDALEARLIGRFDARIAAAQSATFRWMLGGWATIMLLLL